MKFDVNNLVRENIKQLKPYSSARSEYAGSEGIFLDANENTEGIRLSDDLFQEFHLNRYPDSMQIELKTKIGALKKIDKNCIFIGNGSDEVIDLLLRAFCYPEKDQVIVCPPTYGMYTVLANINGVEVVNVPLLKDVFQVDLNHVMASITDRTKLIFLCGPNNPTGTELTWTLVQTLLEQFNGIVVVDEAYIDFAGYDSLILKLMKYPNLVVLQTFSKAWGLAALRVGMAFASAPIVAILGKIKSPYNVNTVSQKLALSALDRAENVYANARKLILERTMLSAALKQLPYVMKVYPSEANFLLVKMINPNRIYNHLVRNKIIVRNRSSTLGCEGCLRITVGTKEENEFLIHVLENYNEKNNSY